GRSLHREDCQNRGDGYRNCASRPAKRGEYGASSCRTRAPRRAFLSFEKDSEKMEFKEIVPFTYHAPQNALDDLKQRLAQTRWPERETTNDWSGGVPLEKLRALIHYWRTDYNWRRCEEALNRFPQFRTEIDRLSIHFIHVRS